jgi:hypothetical protein
MYQYIVLGPDGVSRGMKGLPGANQEGKFSHETLSKEWGLNIPVNLSWEVALTRIKEYDRIYIKQILNSGHDLDEKVNIKLSTIHGAKGGESQNVVVFSDISKRINDNLWANRDEERRVFYVAMTRAKENLYIVPSSSPYEFEEDTKMIFEQQMDLLKKDNKPEWTRPNFPDVTGIKQVAVDLETYDPEIKNLGGGWATNKGFVVGVAISFEGFDGYFPVRHERGGNFSEEDVKNWLKKLFKQDPIVICHNAVYDLGWLRRWGVECNVTKVYDTLIAAPLVDENRFSYSLDNLSKDYLGERKQGNILEDFGKEHGFKAIENMHMVPVEYAGIYAEQDTRLTLKLWEFLRVENSKTRSYRYL